MLETKFSSVNKYLSTQMQNQHVVVIKFMTNHKYKNIYFQRNHLNEPLIESEENRNYGQLLMYFCNYKGKNIKQSQSTSAETTTIAHEIHENITKAKAYQMEMHSNFQLIFSQA